MQPYLARAIDLIAVSSLILATSCLSQGLTTLPQPATVGGSNSSGNTGSNTSGGNSSTPAHVAKLSISATTLLNENNSSLPFEESYADSYALGPEVISSRYATAAEFVCINNVIRAFDPANPDTGTCAKPGISHTGIETSLAQQNSSLSDELSRAVAQKIIPGAATLTSLPSVISGVQLTFSHRTTTTDVPSSAITLEGMWAETADIKIEPDTGKLYWTNLQRTYYQGWESDCNFIAANGVGFSSSDKYSFLTGLWVMERQNVAAFETVSPPVCSRSTDDPLYCQLFASRATVWSSFIVPYVVGSQRSFEFFPGGDSTDMAPSPTVALGLKTTFGRYRDPGTLPLSNKASLPKVPESSLVPRANPQSANDGGWTTYKLGIDDPKGADTPGWQQRALVGLCINGTRINTDYNPNHVATPSAPIPLVKVIRSEFQTITINYH